MAEPADLAVVRGQSPRRRHHRRIGDRSTGHRGRLRRHQRGANSHSRAVRRRWCDGRDALERNPGQPRLLPARMPRRRVTDPEADMSSALEYYRTHGSMTALMAGAAQLKTLPRDLPVLVRIIQGDLLHAEMAPFLYNVKFTEEQRRDMNLRPLETMLSRIGDIDARPLTAEREPARRLPCV